MIRLLQNVSGLRLFCRPAALPTAWKVVVWWEVRRPTYNLIVGTTGILTCLLLAGMAELASRILGWAVVPLVPLGAFLVLASVLFYGLMANVCYTCGWVAELMARSVWKDRSTKFGEMTFLLGTMFSVALTLLPLLIYPLVIAVGAATSGK